MIISWKAIYGFGDAIRPERGVCSRLSGLLGILVLSKRAFAAGETGPVGLEGLVEILLQITIYPVIGVALAFLFFRATNKAWTFILIPLFYWGLSTLAPIIPSLEPVPEDPPFLFIAFIAWLYLPLVLATAICFRIFSRTKKGWVFLLTPVLGWLLQFAGFVFLVGFMG